jgi:hypothetical protein
MNTVPSAELLEARARQQEQAFRLRFTAAQAICTQASGLVPPSLFYRDHAALR